MPVATPSEGDTASNNGLYKHPELKMAIDQKLNAWLSKKVGYDTATVHPGWFGPLIMQKATYVGFKPHLVLEWCHIYMVDNVHWLLPMLPNMPPLAFVIYMGGSNAVCHEFCNGKLGKAVFSTLCRTTPASA